MAAPTWDIVQLERHLPDGAVYTVHWTVFLEEEGETANAYGSVGLGAPDPNAFIPFDQLTKEQVLDWLFDAIGVDQMTNIQESLHKQIEEKVNPTSAPGLPW